MLSRRAQRTARMQQPLPEETPPLIGGAAVAPPASLKAAVAVPVYDHAATLRAVVAGVLRELKQASSTGPAPHLAPHLALHPAVLVVDDGSRDAPERELDGLEVLLLRHPRNLGKGAALLTAARAARELGCTHLVTLDADGQHLPEDLPAFFQGIAREPHAVHVGLRDFSAPGVPRASRFGRWFSNFWLRVHPGRRLGDSQSGFRAYPLAALLDLPLRDRRYSFEVEVLVKAAWAGLPLQDIPIRVHYPPQRVSHFRALQDNLRITLLNTRLTMRALLPWPHRQLLARTGANGTEPGFRVLRLRESVRLQLRRGVTPRSLALSGALGMGIGCLPLFGVQTVTVLAAAAWTGGNRFVALGVNQLCMPPLVPALCIEVGHYLRHGRFLTEISLRTLGYEAPQRLWEWLLGGLVLGPLLALLMAALLWCTARMLLPRAGEEEA